MPAVQEAPVSVAPSPKPSLPQEAEEIFPLRWTSIPPHFIPPAWLVLSLVLLATTLVKLRNLDHTALTSVDEVCHAVVAQNVLKHPLKPTLVDVPYLPYEPKNWHENHVWLHKPILPFWQIASSFAILGVSTFALRLPSVLLSTAAAWLTYLIGKELLDRRAALFAATLQAANPALLRLIDGYQFAYHIDMALLFWVEAGMYFLIRALRTGRWRDVLLAGVAQGLAFLSKSYLAAIILGVAVTAWLLPHFRLGKREACRIGLIHLFGLLGATLLTALLWQVWCMTCFPQEFWHEHQQVWKHLNSNIEGWIAPWDRLLFDYMVFLHGVFYTGTVVAGVVLLGKALAQRHTGLWLLYAWALGVVLPHLLAPSKTPSATVIAMPPLLLLLGSLVSQVWKRDRFALAGLLGIMVMSLIFPAVIKDPGYGYSSPRVFGGVMWKAMWVNYQVAGALVIAGALRTVDQVIANVPAPGEARVRRCLQGAALAFSLAVLAWLGVTTVEAAWRVTDQNAGDPTSVAVGEFARQHLPDNAVLLCEEWRSHEYLTIWWGLQPGKTPSFINRPVGQESFAEVDDEGFYFQEYNPVDQPFRWTNGHGRLGIPIDLTNPPGGAPGQASGLPGTGDQESPAAIVVNTHSVFQGDISADYWEQRLDLRGINLGEQVVVELISGTFCPLDVGDTRTLGVLVLGITLVGKEKTSPEVPHGIVRANPAPRAAVGLRDEQFVCLDFQAQGNEGTEGAFPGDYDGNGKLPLGELILEGVKFNIGKKHLQLKGTNLPNRPTSFLGIKVDHKATRLHFLHGTGWSTDNGTIIGEYVVAWDDGTTVTIPIRFGKDLHEYAFDDSTPEPTEARTAWNGEHKDIWAAQGKHIRLFLMTWENPKPNQKLKSIDFRSTNTACPPFCVAITAGAPPAQVPQFLEPAMPFKK